MYRMSAIAAGLDYAGVALAPDFSLDEKALLEAIAPAAPRARLDRLSEQSHR
jgi:histidinol-phosphate/aromatic aminotransferase/cobyric acid decarboxylase-like protein